MLKVEYLIFNDKKSVKSSNVNSFIHLLQSDPDLTIDNGIIKFKEFSTQINIESGKIENSGDIYFHLKFYCDEVKDIEKFTNLLKAVRGVIHLTNKNPQVLYDGISLYYSKLAYPEIFEVENLMRKLISKFMLINAGIDWTKERTPDDVKKSINSGNNDQTYLHNVDFIQLKNFLFSENYQVHKDSLVKKLKSAENLNDVNLDELKLLIPISNWDKYFFNKLSIPKEKLSDEWNELYQLRCKVAHNKTFNKSDFEKTEDLCLSLKDSLNKAIENLDEIKLSKIEQEDITEKVAGNFNFAFGEFISTFRELEDTVTNTIMQYLLSNGTSDNEGKSEITKQSFVSQATFLRQAELIASNLFIELLKIYSTRNKIVHNDEEIDLEQINTSISTAKEINSLLKQIDI